MYWGASNIISVIQSQVLKNPAIKKLLKIPELPTPTPLATNK